MNYKMLRLTVYNKRPDAKNSFFCEVRLPDKDATLDHLMKEFVSPGFTAVFHRLIPAMPYPLRKGKPTKKFMDWERRYWGAPDA